MEQLRRQLKTKAVVSYRLRKEINFAQGEQITRLLGSKRKKIGAAILGIGRVLFEPHAGIF